MDKSATSRKYAVGTVFVVLMTLLIEHVYFSSVKSPLKEVLAREEKVSPLLEPETLTKLAPKVAQMSLVSVVLPLPPTIAESQPKEQDKKQHKLLQDNVASSEQAPVHPIAKTSDAQVLINPYSMKNRYSEPNKFQITQRLNQLVALKGIDRTLYFPDAHTRQILAYMHNCVGIDIGAVSENNLTLFSHKNNVHSQIVRAANGYKTTQETALLAAYAPNQILVRLYPKWFDERLGKEIASSLGSQKLTQLSGEYALRGHSLWLTEVNLNSKPINREWLLSQGC